MSRMFVSRTRCSPGCGGGWTEDGPAAAPVLDLARRGHIGNGPGWCSVRSRPAPDGDFRPGDANMQHPMRLLGLCLCVMSAGMGAAYAQSQDQDQGTWSSRWGAHNPATAADTGLYVGAGYVRAQVNNVFNTTGYGFKIDDNAWKAILGFRPIPPFAVEANYVDLGHQSQRLLGGFNPSGHADARAFDI